MKKLCALILSVVLVSVVLTGCNKSSAGSSSGGKAKNGIELTILGMVSYQDDINLVRDMLTKAGFVVKLNMQPDYASFKAQQDAGNYDLAISSWTTVTGNPDYAVRSLFKTGGDYNGSEISNPKVDELIETAAAQTPAEYVKTYQELEKELVDKNAYIIPLYRSVKSQGVNQSILKPETVRISKALSMAWWSIDFKDASKRNTQPMITSQALSSLTTLDPIKGNDGSINMINSNMYLRLITLTDDDQVVTGCSLAYQFAIGQGNSDFYFILRDDVNFAKVENMRAVDTGVRVGAEDVVYSLNRAKDRNSVPDHRTYSLHESMKEISIITDLSVLDTVKDSDTGKTIRQILEAKTPTAIRELTNNKARVNNNVGVYQLVKVTTNFPFPQVLNYLAHQSAGIVCADHVRSINTYDVQTFDRTKDIPYGDQRVITQGPTYNNHLWVSGPYIALYKDDYGIYFEKNPHFMRGTEHEPVISRYEMKFIADADAQLSAFRSGETYVLYTVPTSKWDLVKNDPNLKLLTVPSNAVYYLLCNLKGTLSNVNLRLAVLYSIDQDDILTFYNNNYYRAYTTLTPLVETGNVLIADPAKVNDYLNKYWASK